MQRQLNNSSTWTKNLAKSRFSQGIIFISFFLDSCIFPFPTTVIFIAVSVIIPSRSYINALIATVGMVTGSILGYSIGQYLWLLPDGNFTQLATYLFNHIPGFTELNYHYMQSLLLKWGYTFLLFSLILPVPYQFYSITAGVFDFNFFAFILLTLLFQGVRFLTIAWLTVRYGEGVKIIVRKNQKLVVIICVLIVLLILISILYGFKVH
jgi:membrane protein YqaA with SNARE-associated domain